MKRYFPYVFILVAICGLYTFANGQTSEFTYQGNLVFNGQPATGNYDFEFSLFSAFTAGTQIGQTLPRTNVVVTDGAFSVPLIFAGAFPGADRFLEIKVRPSGSGAYTPLSPRHLITSSPYAVRSLTTEVATIAINANSATNATNLGGIAANQYVLTSDPRMSDARNPLPNSTSYLQNRTTQQANTNFNISGTGTANLFNAQSQFNIVGNRVLSLPNSTTNTAVGVNAGVNSGISNSTAIGNGAVATTNNTVVLGRTTERVIAPGSMIIGNQTSGRGELSIYPSGTNADLYMQGLGTDNGINIAAAPDAIAPVRSNLIISSFDGATHGELVKIRPFENGGLTSFATAVEVRGGYLEVAGTIAFEPRTGTASTSPLCQFVFSSGSQLANCNSSALRYKTNIQDFRGGLDLVRRLRPVSFNWKDGGQADFGFVAEEVAEVEPLLVNYNGKGEIEGVKYDRIGVLLINTVKEQQERIEQLERELRELRQLLMAGSNTEKKGGN